MVRAQDLPILLSSTCSSVLIIFQLRSIIHFFLVSSVLREIQQRNATLNNALWNILSMFCTFSGAEFMIRANDTLGSNMTISKI